LFNEEVCSGTIPPRFLDDVPAALLKLVGNDV
jgi:hypothetical protein